MRDEYRAGMDAIPFEQTFQRRLIDKMIEEVDRQDNRTPSQAWLAIGLGIATFIGVLVWLFSGEEH